MKTNKWISSLVITAVMLSSQGLLFAQIPLRDEPDKAIDAVTRSSVIDAALKKLNDNYVFPEIAKKMEEAVRARMERKEYDHITSAKQLAAVLQGHLQEVSHDKHLRVQYSASKLPPERGEAREPSAEERAREMEFLRTVNFGFEKVERLPGNVGYLDLRGFMPAQFGGETVVAAMNFLANTDALIIDLRRNGGGDPAMVALISSYLFEEPVHLNDLYFRPADSTRQWWTLPHVPGKRFGGKKDVFVLTSKRTFSAAEEFTYNLKNLKRATIVGETTGGGAHPGGPRRISDHFSIWVPSGRAINPISKTNWEGTGVTPDVDVPSDQALKVAHIDALEKLLSKVSEDERRGAITRTIETVKRELNEMKQNPTRNQ